MEDLKKYLKLLGSVGLLFFAGVFFAMLESCASEESATRVSASDGDADADADTTPTPMTPSDFYRQCTDSRCDFHMLEGERVVGGVPTWYKNDTGFRLEGDPVVLAVTDEYAAHPEVPVSCYTVRILGSWGNETAVSFEVEGEYGVFGISAGEGENPIIDTDTLPTDTTFYSKSLPENEWQLQTFELKTLSYRGELVFSIRKRGSGTAVFYFVEIDGEKECTGDAIAVD